jgi:hypothetical protein
VPAPLLLDALREEAAPHDAKASARRSSRLKPFPNGTAASNWSAQFSEESDLSSVVVRVAVRVVRSREALFPGRCDPPTVTSDQRSPPRARNYSLCQPTKNLHPVGRRGVTDCRFSTPSCRTMAKKDVVRMIHLGHLPDASGSPEDATGILPLACKYGVGGSRQEYAFGASDV